MFSSTILVISAVAAGLTANAYPAHLESRAPYSWQANGCLIDSWNRALSSYQFTNASMTVEMCQTACRAQNYSYAGLEYGNQCFCANSVTYGEYSSGASATPQSQCNKACVGNSAENCGGDWYLQSYIWSNAIPAAAATSTAAPSTSTIDPAIALASAQSASSVSSVSSVSAARAFATAIPSGWQVASTSCIAEGTTGRALQGVSFTSPSMTWSTCVSYCSNLGYIIAGVEYSSECYCGDILRAGASLTKSSSNCNMACSGNSLANCGGPNALTLFASSAAVSTLNSDLTSKNLVLPTGWSAASTACIAEGSSGRALAAASTSSDSMTVTSCLQFCQKKGFQYAGLEYSRECYCGDALVDSASLSLPSTQCNMPCSGDDATNCGGSNALQLYSNPSLALSLTIVNGFASQGCFQEVNGRALPHAVLVQSNMTISTCTAHCSANGYSYAGLEYSAECYCGNSLENGASTSLHSEQCVMPCAGDATQTCGGPDAITLYRSQ